MLSEKISSLLWTHSSFVGAVVALERRHCSKELVQGVQEKLQIISPWSTLN